MQSGLMGEKTWNGGDDDMASSKKERFYSIKN